MTIQVTQYSPEEMLFVNVGGKDDELDLDDDAK